MKRMIVWLLAVMLMVSLVGCAAKESITGVTIQGDWYGVEVLEDKIRFFHDGTGLFSIMDDADQKLYNKFNWEYDDVSRECIIQAEKEYQGKITVQNNAPVLEFNGRRYALAKDRGGLRSEYLSKLSKETAAKAPQKERMEALLAEYRELFQDAVPLQLGAEYDTPIYGKTVKFVKLWKDEDPRGKLHLELVFTGDSAPMDLFIGTDGFSIYQDGYSDVAVKGVHVNWYLCGGGSYGGAGTSPMQKLEEGKNYTFDVNWYDRDYKARTLDALEEISAKHGFHDKREDVADALRKAKLPIAYALVDTIGEVWLMDLTELMEE